MTPPVLLLAVSSAVVNEPSGFCTSYFDRYVPLPDNVKRPYGVAPVENFRSTSTPLISVRPILRFIWLISTIGPGKPSPNGAPRVISEPYFVVSDRMIAAGMPLLIVFVSWIQNQSNAIETLFVGSSRMPPVRFLDFSGLRLALPPLVIGNCVTQSSPLPSVTPGLAALGS